MNMKSFLFDGWHQWKVCMVAGLKKFGWGLCRILTCLFFGFVSLLVALWRYLVKLVGRFPCGALVVMLVCCAIIWLLTFTYMRHRAVVAEDQRDSLTYQFGEYKKIYEPVMPVTVVMNGDTIAFGI